MLSFGKPIKHKVVYLNTDNVEVNSTLTCINEIAAIKILKSFSQTKFKELISCEKLDDCEDCKL